MLNSLAQLFTILAQSQHRKIVFLFFPMAIATGAELVSIASILPLVHVTMVGNIEHELVKYFAKFVPSYQNIGLSWWFALIFIAFFILKNIFLLLTYSLINKVIHQTGAYYTSDLFRRYLHRPLLYHFDSNSGVLLRNLTLGVRLTMDAVRQLLVMCFELMVFVGVVLFLFFIEPAVTSGSALFLCLIGILYYFVFSPIFKVFGDRSVYLQGMLNKWILSSLEGIKDVKINGSTRYLVSKVSEVTSSYADVSAKFATAIQIPRLLIETMVIVGGVAVLYSSIILGDSRSEVIVTLSLFGMAALRLIPTLNRILSSASNLRRYSSDIESVYEAYKYEDDNRQLETVKTKERTHIFQNVLVISNLDYKYPGANKLALKNINLEINKGDFVGISGTSGSGKSTLLDILLGLLEPKKGLITVDSKEIKQFARSWQNSIGLVPQNIFIAEDTIRNNIAFGIMKPNINDDRVNKVIGLAGLEQVVKRLPAGLDTLLGEHGIGLSGGELQRVCIARALYGEPSTLVFDEATSSLDQDTKREIMKTIQKLSADHTVIMVTHDLDTLEHCDTVIQLEDGAIMSCKS